jgi:hypothetical protein
METIRRRRIAAAIAAIVTAAALAFPVFAASPAPSPTPGATDKAHVAGNGHGNGRANGSQPDKSHEPETPVTLRGTVARGADADGHPGYTLQAAVATYTLSIGPPWFWGDTNPLEAYVGRTVTVAGEREGSGSEVDVQSVDGKALREPGKPPWAGGPKAVGPAHPGYKAWKDAQDKSSPAP